MLTCVTLKIRTYRPIKRCHVSWRKSLNAPLIRLWYMSLIKLYHVSLTHSQTPINRSLPKAFLHTKTSRALATSKKIQKHSKVQKLYKNQASKSSRTSTSKSKNIRSKTIQTTCLELKVCWNQAQSLQKLQQTTNQWSSTDFSPKSFEELPP